MSTFFVVISLLALPKLIQAACHGSKTSYRAEFQGKLTIDNVVLANHVIATFSVKSFTQCFSHCDEDCRCRSFNLPMSGEGECELNSADNSTVLMKPKRGWRYHHLQVKEVIAGSVSLIFYFYFYPFLHMLRLMLKQCHWRYCFSLTSTGYHLSQFYCVDVLTNLNCSPWRSSQSCSLLI